MAIVGAASVAARRRQHIYFAHGRPRSAARTVGVIMTKLMSLFLALLFSCGVAVAQNTNSPATTDRQRTTNTNRAKPAPTDTEKPAASAPKKTAPAGQQAPGSEGVLAAFNALLDGIRHANVNEVMEVYWNNPQLNLFNYNGTVTKSWEQVARTARARIRRLKT